MTFPTILSLETSCDETAAAVMQGGILRSHDVASQMVHADYGGVVPELASRAHQSKIVPVVVEALRKAEVELAQVDAVGVTQGPGLLGALLVGTAFANGLGLARRLPLIGIHHTRAHLLANWITPPHPAFPCLGLVVSGGHTQLVQVDGPLQMTLLGSTLDDAVGEAFDKVAKMLGFPYPGGIHIDRQATNGDPKRFAFPKTKTAGFDFSFSGIKTAFLYFLQKQKDPNFIKNHLADLCASIQATLVATLLQKVTKAMHTRKLHRVLLGGGVANNRLLRSELQAAAERYGWEVFVPKPDFCTDNAAMIAMAAHYALQAGKPTARYIEPMPRMPFA